MDKEKGELFRVGVTNIGQNQKCAFKIENKHGIVMLNMQKHDLHKFKQPVTNPST